MDYLDTGIVGTVHAGIWSANPKIRHYIIRTDSNVNQSSVNSNHLNTSGLTEYQINITYLTS